MEHDSRRTREELLGSTLVFGAFASEDLDPCPFGDGKLDTDKVASMRGRLSATAQAIAVNSYRTCMYAFVLMPQRARLLRFDHTGVVYTELFSWRTSGDLASFLARFESMSATEIGCDTSVTSIPSNSEEVVRAKEILRLCDNLPSDVQKSAIIPLNYNGRLSLMHVFDDETRSFHRVVCYHAMASATCFP